jgi:chemotaxis family two-component system response regulator Rcp1
MTAALLQNPVRILLVEDNPGDVLLVRRALRDNKISNEFKHVEDGLRALQFVRGEGIYVGQSQPDLILLDLNLPLMDGREVLAELKGDPLLRHIPVVIMTSSAAESDILRSYQLHANCFVTKPLDLNQLIGVINSIENFWVNIVRLPKRSM